MRSYCDWGVDYLKIDQCQGQRYAALNTSWIKFRAAIDECTNARGYPMVMSIESCDDPATCGLSKHASLNGLTPGRATMYLSRFLNAPARTGVRRRKWPSAPRNYHEA